MNALARAAVGLLLGASLSSPLPAQQNRPAGQKASPPAGPQGTSPAGPPSAVARGQNSVADDRTTLPAPQKKSPIGKAASALDAAAKQRELRKATDRYDPAFQKYTKRYFGPGFDWHPFKAQGMAESDLRPNARSRVGARGIMQLMPATYQMIKSARPEFKSIDHPDHNIAAGIMHDRYLWTLYPSHTDDERMRFMFAAYNAGEGTIKRARNIAAKERLDPAVWNNVEQIAPKVKPWRYTETLGYVKKIEQNRARLKGADK